MSNLPVVDAARSRVQTGVQNAKRTISGQRGMKPAVTIGNGALINQAKATVNNIRGQAVRSMHGAVATKPVIGNVGYVLNAQTVSPVYQKTNIAIEQ